MMNDGIIGDLAVEDVDEPVYKSLGITCRPARL